MTKYNEADATRTTLDIDETNDNLEIRDSIDELEDIARTFDEMEGGNITYSSTAFDVFFIILMMLIFAGSIFVYVKLFQFIFSLF